jgi:hypothetical protein
MPFIPRQVKPPARVTVTCKLPEHVATGLKCYAEFLDSSQEHVVTETLRLAFRRDREFQAWLTKTHPDIAHVGVTASAETAERPKAASPKEGRPSRPARATQATPEQLATPSTSKAPASQER